MSINLDTHKAPRPQPIPKLQLPPIVRDYLEHVRGDPKTLSDIPPDYLDRLWAQATEFATRNAVACPVHHEEIEALRAAIEDGAFLKKTPSPCEAALMTDLGAGAPYKSTPKRGNPRSSPSEERRRLKTPPGAKMRRLSAPQRVAPMASIVRDRPKAAVGRSVAPGRAENAKALRASPIGGKKRAAGSSQSGKRPALRGGFRHLP